MGLDHSYAQSRMLPMRLWQSRSLVQGDWLCELRSTSIWFRSSCRRPLSGLLGVNWALLRLAGWMSCMSSSAFIWITVGFLKIIQIKYKWSLSVMYTLKSLLHDLLRLGLGVGSREWAWQQVFVKEVHEVPQEEGTRGDWHVFLSVLALKQRLPLLPLPVLVCQQNSASIFRVINSKSTAPHFAPTAHERQRVLTNFFAPFHSIFGIFLSILGSTLDTSHRRQPAISKHVPLASLQLLVREAMSALRLELPEAVEVELADKAFELAVPKVERDDFLLHFVEVGDLDDRLIVGPVDDVGVVVVLNGRGGTSSSDQSLSMKFPIFASAFIFENSIISQVSGRSSMGNGEDLISLA